ncbi:CCA tRNA nucleotidyltransferase [Candidatus Woesearchaeota archaeon]|nr:CCA tRNA nucleotidyltransferase [Candidatus Woesearchaeota archaeon]
MKFLASVKSSLQPSAGEKRLIESEARTIIRKLSSIKGAKAVLGGSGAKGTWIGGAVDVDIFVCYEYRKFSGKSGKLSEMLAPELKKRFRGVKRLHGSRDYFQIRRRGVTFEIVPILAIRKASEAKNITDVSPLHAKWVNRKVKRPDEVRLIKAFCKAQGIYGAESHIKGFSGYVCEILAYRYGSFIGLLKAASKWKAPVVIDVAHYYKSPMEVSRSLNRSKLSPLIIIDPVQKERNAAAALSEESFKLFISCAKKFLRNPSAKFFERKEPSAEEIKAKKDTVAVSVVPLKGKEDISATKVLKAMEHLKAGLEKNDFFVKSSDWFWNRKRTLIWFTLESEVIEKEKKVAGPPAGNKFHEQRFRKAHKRTFKRNGRLYAVVMRKFTDSKKLLRRLLKDSYVRERVSSVEVL